MIVLTKEEMVTAYGIEGEYGTMERVCRTQLKKVVEDMEKPCFEHGDYVVQHRRQCPDCWQALKKEASLATPQPSPRAE